MFYLVQILFGNIMVGKIHLFEFSVRTRMIHFEWIKDGTLNLDQSWNSFSKYVSLPGNCVSLWKREKGWPESDCCSEGKEGEWWFLISQRVGIGNTNSSLPGRPDDAHFKSKNHPIIMFDFIYIIFIIHFLLIESGHLSSRLKYIQSG